MTIRKRSPADVIHTREGEGMASRLQRKATKLASKVKTAIRKRGKATKKKPAKKNRPETTFKDRRDQEQQLGLRRKDKR